MGLGDEGLPVSLQVTGPRCTDGYVLAAAQTIEQVIGFAERPSEPPSPT
jgi:aspartyl-tRNA(Asn)/glutamyl-tRNA(Gln) amidotransferase subunit A